jgi:hypothetical protein
MDQGHTDAPNRWDKGKGRILSNPIRKLLKEYNIHHFVNSDFGMAEILEQFNRTLIHKEWCHFTVQSHFNTFILFCTLSLFTNTWQSVKKKSINVIATNSLDL